MEKNIREMHRTAAAQTGTACRDVMGQTLPAPPAEPGCLRLPALHIDTNVFVPSRIWGLPYYK